MTSCYHGYFTTSGLASGKTDNGAQLFIERTKPNKPLEKVRRFSKYSYLKKRAETYGIVVYYVGEKEKKEREKKRERERESVRTQSTPTPGHCLHVGA